MAEAATKLKQGTGPLYPMVSTPYFQYIREVSAQILKEISKWSFGKVRQGLEHRSSKMVACASHLEGWECDECGETLEASAGFYDPPEGEDGHRRHPCEARVCPRCARRKSAEAKGWGDRLLEKLETPNGNWRLRMGVLTDAYDPSSDRDLTVNALRARLEGFRLAFRAVWKWYKGLCSPENRGKAGALCAVEMSGTGHVHLHMLFWGPFVPENEMWWVAKRAWTGVGKIRDIELADKKSIAECIKYPIGTKGAACEAWLRGEPAYKRAKGTGEILGPALVNPVLAARWEVALYGKRIFDKYGSFRKERMKEKNDAALEKKELPPFCPKCGHRKPWRRVVEPTVVYLARFEGRLEKALSTPRNLKRRRERDRYGGEDPGFDAG